MVEVDPFSFHDERPFVDLRMDRADVLAEHPDEEELNCTEEVDSDQERRQAKLKLVPEHELGDEVPDRDEQADYGDGESRHRGEAERHLGVIGDTQHGDVVQGEEIILRFVIIRCICGKQCR